MMLLLLVVALFRHPNGHSNVSRALPGQADFTHTHTLLQPHPHRSSHSVLIQLILNSLLHSLHDFRYAAVSTVCHSHTHSHTKIHTDRLSKSQTITFWSAANARLTCGTLIYHRATCQTTCPHNRMPASKLPPPPILHATTTVVIDRGAKGKTETATNEQENYIINILCILCETYFIRFNINHLVLYTINSQGQYS